MSRGRGARTTNGRHDSQEVRTESAVCYERWTIELTAPSERPVLLPRESKLGNWYSQPYMCLRISYSSIKITNHLCIAFGSKQTDWSAWQYKRHAPSISLHHICVYVCTGR